MLEGPKPKENRTSIDLPSASWKELSAHRDHLKGDHDKEEIPLSYTDSLDFADKDITSSMRQIQTPGAMVKRLRSRWFQLKAFQSSKPHSSSKFKGSTFNDQSRSDSSRFSGILERSK